MRTASKLPSALLLWGSAACSPSAPPGDASVDASAEGSVAAPYDCAALGCAAGEAPVPAGDGGLRCVAAGANEARSPAPFPDATGLTGLVVYVSASAPAGGDGSSSRPYATVDEALARAPAAVLLGAGSYRLSGTLAPSAALLLRGVGAGADGTVLSAPAGATAALSASAELRLEALRVEAVPDAAALRVVRPGTLRLREVSVRGGRSGVLCEGGTLDAAGLSVQGAVERGVALLEGPSGGACVATLARLRATGGQGVGVLAYRAQLALDTALLAGNARDGLAVVEGAGVEAQLTSVASACNGVTGLRVEGAGARAVGRALLVAGTSVPAGTQGGYGVYVSGGAALRLDPRAGPVDDSLQNTGSQVLHNSVAGVVVSGGASGSAPASTLDMVGARVADNEGPGLFGQLGAQLEAVRASVFEGNAVVGVALSSGATLRYFLCDGALGTRPGSLAQPGGPLYLEGDGLSVTSQSSVQQVQQSRLENNGRFGALFVGAAASQFLGNRGGGNRFGVGIYGSAVVDSANTVSGREPSPAAAPAAVMGSLSP